MRDGNTAELALVPDDGVPVWIAPMRDGNRHKASHQTETHDCLDCTYEGWKLWRCRGARGEKAGFGLHL